MNIRRWLGEGVGLRDIKLVLAGDIVGKGFSFLATLMIMKRAGPYELGLFSFFLSVLSFGVPLSDLGLNNTMVKYVSSAERQDQKVAWRYLKAALELKTIIVIPLMIAIILLADGIAGSVLHEPDTAGILVLAAVAVVGSAYKEFYASTLQAYQLFKKLTIFRLTENILKLILVYIVLTWFGFHLLGIILIFVMLPFLLIVQGISFFPSSYLRSRFSRPEIYSELFHFGKWVALSTISAVIMLQLDVFMLSSMRDMNEVGIYSAAYKLCLPFFALVNSITVVLYPRAMVLSGPGEYREYIRKVLTLTLPIAVIMVLVVLIGSDFIFSYFPQYEGSSTILRVLIVGFAIILVTNPISMILYSANMPKMVALINGVQLIVDVIGNWLLISRYGSLGAAVTTVGVWVLGAIVFTVFSVRVARDPKTSGGRVC